MLGMPNLIDVARHASVSLSTASVVLNPGPNPKRVSQAKSRLVRQAATELGYVPNYHARSMKRGRADALGVIIEIPGVRGPMKNTLGLGYWGSLVGGFEGAARRAGSAALILGPDTHRTATQRAVEAIQQRQIDGAVLIGGILPEPSRQALRKAETLPIVGVDAPSDLGISIVEWDERRGVDLAVEHLAALGHRRVVWLGPRNLKASDGRRTRLELAGEAMRQAGLAMSQIEFEACSSQRESMRDAAEHAMVDWWRNHGDAPDRPTAVLAYGDLIGFGALGAIAQLGLSCPADVSVMCFDNIEAPLATPKLTAVDHMLMTMGQTAAKVLLEAIDGGGAAIEGRQHVRQVISPRLVVRQSTGPAPSHRP